jgi:NAD(P)-dependent dehydrogenase (short-subunit alcohol dehydrogenase family)
MKGKTFFVTGGNTGIGLATARRFASEGAHIAILSIGEDVNAAACREIEALGAECLAITGDVTSAQDVAAAIDATCDRFGGLHYAFNNAGAGQNSSMITEQEEAEFDRLMTLNAKGIWLGMKYEIPAILRSGGGAIVNSASASGIQASAQQAIYCATKHAVVGMTRAVALDYAALGIRVNAIAPGVVNTEMIQRYAKDNADMWDDILSRHPMNCVAEPEEVAAAVLFLSRDATKTTGTVFSIDCGSSI